MYDIGPTVLSAAGISVVVPEASPPIASVQRLGASRPSLLSPRWVPYVASTSLIFPASCSTAKGF
jgi:hypothetical protein